MKLLTFGWNPPKQPIIRFILTRHFDSRHVVASKQYHTNLEYRTNMTPWHDSHFYSCPVMTSEQIHTNLECKTNMTPSLEIRFIITRHFDSCHVVASKQNHTNLEYKTNMTPIHDIRFNIIRHFYQPRLQDKHDTITLH